LKEEKKTEQIVLFIQLRSGDNLYKIAKKYKVTVNQILRLNHIKNANLIYPREKLRIKSLSER